MISRKRLIFFFKRLPGLTSYLNLRLHFINLLQFGSMKIFIKMIWIFFIFETVDGGSPIRLQKWLIWSIIMFIFLTDIIMIPWNVCWLLIIFQHIIVSYWALICVEIYWVLGLRSLIKIQVDVQILIESLLHGSCLGPHNDFVDSFDLRGFHWVFGTSIVSSWLLVWECSCVPLSQIVLMVWGQGCKLVVVYEYWMLLVRSYLTVLISIHFYFWISSNSSSSYMLHFYRQSWTTK